ncbi:MAG TPA: hypothetical protein VJN32_04040 [Dehalococcoidia bacterium]|nr:hypothetical protein [Dehalococcoidia bacterium]
MGRGQFDDIFEECLSALLEGRRSIEESLSLYPAWRGRLEPLLRAAEEISVGLETTPPLYVKERGLQAFLDSARARRRLRQILPPQAVATPPWRWASTGLAAVVVIGVLAFMSATLMAGEGQKLRESESVSVKPYAPRSPDTAPPREQTPLQRVQQQVAALEESVRRGQPVADGQLEELQRANDDLAAGLADPSEVALVDRVAAVSIASKQYELLQELQERSSGANALAVQEGLETAAGVLELLGTTVTPPAGTPTPEPAASPTPVPSPQPSASPGPGTTPSPAPSATPTP